MTDMQFIIIVLIMAFATFLTRVVPFLVFGNRQKAPAFIDYLSKVLPSAMMGLLVVYCFRNTDFNEVGEVLPAIGGTLTVVLLHLWKRNTIISIALGTATYMILLRLI